MGLREHWIDCKRVADSTRLTTSQREVCGVSVPGARLVSRQQSKVCGRCAASSAHQQVGRRGWLALSSCALCRAVPLCWTHVVRHATGGACTRCLCCSHIQTVGAQCSSGDAAPKRRSLIHNCLSQLLALPVAGCRCRLAISGPWCLVMRAQFPQGFRRIVLAEF